MMEQPWLQDLCCQSELPSSQAVFLSRCNSPAGTNSTMTRVKIVENCVASCQLVHTYCSFDQALTVHAAQYTVVVYNFANSFHFFWGTLLASSDRPMTRLLLYRQKCLFLSIECTFIHMKTWELGWFGVFLCVCLTPPSTSSKARSTARLLHKALFQPHQYAEACQAK